MMNHIKLGWFAKPSRTPVQYPVPTGKVVLIMDRHPLFSALLFFLLSSPLLVLGESDFGYGCREGDLPVSVRRDCHPDPGANDQSCRQRGCVWCDKRSQFPNSPPCFFRDPIYQPGGPTCDAGYVNPLERTDCVPSGTYVDETECRFRNCTWCPTLPEAGIPWCFVPSQIDNTANYEVVGEPVETAEAVTIRLHKNFPNGRPFWDYEAADLIFTAEFQADYRLRVKITTEATRWEVPIVINPPGSAGNSTTRLYQIQYTRNPFSFRILRRSTGVVIFEQTGPLTFADQFLSMSWNLPSDNVYGIGENEQRSFKHDFGDGMKWPLYGADQPPWHTAGLYGVQPHYTVIEPGNNVHAVALVNSNSQEFHMQPGPTIKYITIGGVFDLYFFLGPSPGDTVSQYTEAVGRSQMPAYWALGFQLCRYGYNSIEAMQAAVNRTEAANIPHDVQYGDIDIMEQELDFTYDNVSFRGLPEYIMELKAKGIKFVTILDPFISIIEGPDYEPFTLGEELDIWVKKADGVTPVTGRVWPRDATAPVYFPDYSKASTQVWWTHFITEFHDLLAWDGLWIDMNEPANFENGDMIDGCSKNRWNYPPYKPGLSTQPLEEKTLCPDHRDNRSTHYNTHNLYGWFESEQTLTAVRSAIQKRGLVLSRSTFLGSGKWASHWLGDNWSRWSNLHYSIIGVMQFNLWGIPYVGPDTCGFIGDSNAALCQRWMQLGAFYPFSRNHNGLGYVDQDPAVFGQEVAESTRIALELRYTLLPYLYTLFYHHVTHGSAVFRPLWYNYVQETATHPIDRQFMWGEGILISPVLTENTTSVVAYFPDNKFFSIYDGAEVAARRGISRLDAPLDFIPVHVAGGNIIPTQVPARNTEIARNNTLGLIIAIDDFGNAEGDLFYDDGEGIDTHLNGQYFYATYQMMAAEILTGTTVVNGYAPMGTKTLATLRLMGSDHVTGILVNGVQHTDFTIQPSGEVTVNNLNIVANSNFTVSFI